MERFKASGEEEDHGGRWNRMKTEKRKEKEVPHWMELENNLVSEEE